MVYSTNKYIHPTDNFDFLELEKVKIGKWVAISIFAQCVYQRKKFDLKRKGERGNIFHLIDVSTASLEWMEATERKS